MQLAVVSFGSSLKIEQIDVDSDPLARRYGASVPVLAHGDRVVCASVFDRQALESYLAAMPHAVPPGPQ